MMEVLPSNRVKTTDWWNARYHINLFPGTFVRRDGRFIIWKDVGGQQRRWASSNLVVKCYKEEQLEND
ncbi:hypothetical protein [Erwinia phage Pecta]|nr:hypothetical protein [Erwinia phage Pecta]